MDMSAPSISIEHRLLGDILLDSGKISTEDLARALELQKKSADRLGKLLVDLGMVTERDLLTALGQQLQLPVIDGSEFPPLPPELKSLSPRFMRSGKFFPLDQRDGELYVALADPLDQETVESIPLATVQRPVVHLASENQIRDAIEKFYGAGSSSFGRLVESYEQSE